MFAKGQKAWNDKSHLAPEIVRLYTTTDLSVKAIARELGIDAATAGKHLRGAGIEPTRRYPREGVEKTAAKLRGRKWSEERKLVHSKACKDGDSGRWKRTPEQREMQTAQLPKMGGWNKGMPGRKPTEAEKKKRAETTRNSWQVKETREARAKGIKKSYDESRHPGNLGWGGFVKWFDYEKADGTIARVQGTYELRFAKVMDDLGWDWINYPRERSNLIEYEWEGKISRYGPDFIANIDGEIVNIEVKGWYTDRCKAKVAAFRATGKPLLLVDKNLLHEYERVGG